tara:strand:- start:44 stop:166 length:123 start_codon:yes stop_codon:yes gene_type:complete
MPKREKEFYLLSIDGYRKKPSRGYKTYLIKNLNFKIKGRK